MNLNNLTPTEIIRYIDNGVLTQDIPNYEFVRVVEHMQDEIRSLEAQLLDEEKGYDRGWDAAVEEMKSKLDCM